MSDHPSRSSSFAFYEQSAAHGVFIHGQHGALTYVAGGPSRHIPVDMSDRQVEVPRDSGILDRIVQIAENGGPLYLIRDGVRVGAIVNHDVAESLARDQEDDDEPEAEDPLAVLIEECERTNGGVGEQELDEVDREWRAQLGR